MRVSGVGFALYLVLCFWWHYRAAADPVRATRYMPWLWVGVALEALSQAGYFWTVLLDLGRGG
jgi:hypothetical protein